MRLDGGRRYWQAWLTWFAAATVVSLAQVAPARGASSALPQHSDEIVVETRRLTAERWQLAQSSPQQGTQQQQLEALRRAEAAAAQARAAAQRKAQARGTAAPKTQAAGAKQTPAAAAEEAQAGAAKKKATGAQKKAAAGAAAQQGRAAADKQATDAAAPKKAAEALKTRAAPTKPAQDPAAQKKAAEALKAVETQKKTAEALKAAAAAQTKSTEAVKAAGAQKTAEALRRMGGEAAMKPAQQAGPQPKTYQNVMGATPAAPTGATPQAGPSEATKPWVKPKPGDRGTNKHDRDALATAIAITIIMNLLDPPERGSGSGPPDLLTPRQWPQDEPTTYAATPRVPEPPLEPAAGDAGQETKPVRAKPPWQQSLPPVLPSPVPPEGEQPPTPDPVTPPGMSQAVADALAAKYREPPKPADAQKLQAEADAAAASAYKEAKAKVDAYKASKAAQEPESVQKSKLGDALFAKQKYEEARAKAQNLARTSTEREVEADEQAMQRKQDALAARQWEEEQQQVLDEAMKAKQREADFAAEQAAAKAEAERKEWESKEAEARQAAATAQQNRDKNIDELNKEADELYQNLGQPNVSSPVNVYDGMQTAQDRVKALVDYAKSLPDNDPKKHRALKTVENMARNLEKTDPGAAQGLWHAIGGHLKGLDP
jgi:hypothetical protein